MAEFKKEEQAAANSAGEFKTEKKSDEETSEKGDSKKQGQQERRKKRIRQRIKENPLTYILVALCIALLIAVILLIRPALLASKFSKQFEEIGMQPSEYLTQLEAKKSELAIAKNNFESCQALNRGLVNDIAAEKNATMLCNQQKALLDVQTDELKRQNELNITVMNNAIEMERVRYNDLNRTYSVLYNDLNRTYYTLVRNSASNICCKAKVDDPAVDSYSVANDKIVCGTGEKIILTC